ncbi:hypothetical protein CEXT_135821 [Caerostris extrusa]|uniref:Uncharacterized protein n=1 Tax=Caerostris extrusa TaxID=172846 RepID=A0AAV4RXL7_CAEEX|nr:hypothetical protein CEXT_135821 [Caerostris extrusa]
MPTLGFEPEACGTKGQSVSHLATRPAGSGKEEEEEELLPLNYNGGEWLEWIRCGSNLPIPVGGGLNLFFFPTGAVAGMDLIFIESSYSSWKWIESSNPNWRWMAGMIAYELNLSIPAGSGLNLPIPAGGELNLPIPTGGGWLE